MNVFCFFRLLWLLTNFNHVLSTVIIFDLPKTLKVTTKIKVYIAVNSVLIMDSGY